MAGKPGMVGRKPKAVPERHRPGWLESIDRRYKPAQIATAWLLELQTALGGRDELSPQRRGLTERATWLHIRLQQIEQEYLAGHGLDAGEYTQLINAYLAVLRALGLDRRAIRVPRLADILAEHNSTPRAARSNGPARESVTRPGASPSLVPRAGTAVERDP